MDHNAAVIFIVIYHLHFTIFALNLKKSGDYQEPNQVDVKEYRPFKRSPLALFPREKSAYNHYETHGIDATGERADYSFQNDNNRRTPFGWFHHKQIFPQHYAQRHHNYEQEHSGYEPHYEDQQSQEQYHYPMKMMNEEHSGHMPHDNYMQDMNYNQNGFNDYGPYENSRYGGEYVRRRQFIPQGEDEGGDIDAGGGYFQLSERGGEVDISSSNYTGTHFHMGGGEFNVIRDPWRHHSMFANLFNSHIGDRMPQQPIHELHQHFTYVHNDQNEHHHTHINGADIENKDHDKDERSAVGNSKSEYPTAEHQIDSEATMNLTHQPINNKEYGGYKREHLNENEIKEGHDSFASGDPEQMEKFFGNVDQAMREEVGITNENPPQVGNGIPTAIGNSTKDISKYINRPYNSNGDSHQMNQPIAPIGIVMRKKRLMQKTRLIKSRDLRKAKLHLESLLAKIAYKRSIKITDTNNR